MSPFPTETEAGKPYDALTGALASAPLCPIPWHEKLAAGSTVDLKARVEMHSRHVPTDARTLKGIIPD